MRFWKTKSRLVTALAIVAVVGTGWLVLKPDPKDNTASNQTTNPVGAPAGQPASGGVSVTKDAAGTAFIETADFKYQIPASWVQMKKEVLDQIGATSGIGSVSNLTAIFKTSVSSSTPKDDNQLKNNTLDDIKKNAPNFALLSSLSTKVDGQSGYKFIYSFTDKDGQNKLRQQLSAVPYKAKTFFLLASSSDGDFDKQKGEFDKILNSFRFK